MPVVEKVGGKRRQKLALKCKGLFRPKTYTYEGWPTPIQFLVWITENNLFMVARKRPYKNCMLTGVKTDIFKARWSSLKQSPQTIILLNLTATRLWQLRAIVIWSKYLTYCLVNLIYCTYSRLKFRRTSKYLKEVWASYRDVRESESSNCTYVVLDDSLFQILVSD